MFFYFHLLLLPKHRYSNSHYNTFIGASAGQHVSIGERNVFIGMKSGRCDSKTKGTGFRNTLIGGYNGFNMTTACENSAIGYGSNHSLTEGCLNTSIGNNSGYNITIGNCNVFIGSRCILVEGVKISQGAVLGANVTLTESTPIIDVTGKDPVEHKGVVPENSVIIPGTRPKEFPAGIYETTCALIIRKRKESTNKKTSLNDVL